MKLTWKKFDKEKSDQTICVIDNIGGAYFPIAQELSKYYKKTYFYSFSNNPFPHMELEFIGKGYENIIVINELGSYLKDIDLIVFADIYFSDWGYMLKQLGKEIWGGGISEILETERKLFKQELMDIGMDIAPSKYITGVNNLLDYLKDKEDKWIKVTYYRGEMETDHWDNYDLSHQLLDDLKYNLGPLEDEIEFVIEDPIKSVAELGTDGWTVNGIHPQNQIWGIEVKNCGYIGKTCKTSELPKPLLEVQNRFKPVLTKYNHTGFYSTEVRVGEDGKNYYTDPCMRAGSPPSNTYMMMVSNWDKIISGGANGEIVEPIFRSKYGVEIILKSERTKAGWLPLTFPDEYKDNIKLKGSLYKDNKYWIIPFRHTGFEMTEFGSVVVVGDDLDSIMSQALTIAASIQSPYEIKFDKDALKTATDTLQNVKDKLNIEF